MTTPSCTTDSLDAGTMPALIAIDVQDALLTVSNDLERLQRLLGETGDEVSSAFYTALALIAGRSADDRSREELLVRLDTVLRRGVRALQFEDMASQLIAHTQARLRHSADQLAAAALPEDEDGATFVEDAPLRPNPVTQDEMDAGSVDLF